MGARIQSQPPASGGCEIQWYDGWLEQFHKNEFTKKCVDRRRKVLVYKKGEAPLIAEFSLTVRDRVAELDYGGRFAKPNRRKDRGWDIGRLRIRFSDAKRTSVTSLWWADEGKTKFDELDNWCSWSKRDAFNPNALDRRKKATGTGVLRPGQLRFRNTLKKAYGTRCCMTGFGIWEALEAAHIRPFFGSHSDHVQNGLLVRADLHRLFDRNLIGIEPGTYRITLAAELRGDRDYKHLHGKRIALPDRPADHPNAIALRRRWAEFRKRANSDR